MQSGGHCPAVWAYCLLGHDLLAEECVLWTTARFAADVQLHLQTARVNLIARDEAQNIRHMSQKS